MSKETGHVEYEIPDMTGVFNGLKKFNTVAVSREYDFIPSLQERSSLAARCLSQGARAIISKVRSLEVIVESAGFDELLEQWAAIHAHTQLTVEVHASAINVLSDTCIQRLNRVVSAVAATKAQILVRAAEGEGLNLDHYSDPLLAYDVARLDELEQEVITLQLEEDQLRADKQVVVAAVTTLQSKAWLDHITDLLPTTEHIQALLTTALVGKAEADVVTVAIDRVTQYLGFLEGGHRLFSLTQARNKITDKLADVNVLKNKNRTDVRALIERAEKIRRHAELVEARAYWVDNMKRIANAMAVFSSKVNTAIDVNEHTMVQTSAELAGFQRFLRRIAR